MTGVEIHEILSRESAENPDFTFGFINGKEGSKDKVWFQHSFPDIKNGSGIQIDVDLVDMQTLLKDIKFLKSDETKEKLKNKYLVNAIKLTDMEMLGEFEPIKTNN